MSSKTLPSVGSMRGGDVSPQPPWVRRISAGGSSSLLPTPSASPYGSNQGGSAGRTGKVRPSLDSMARNGLWPTPRVAAARTSRQAILDPDSRSSPSLEQAVELAEGVLPREIADLAEAPPSWARLWPTPRASDATSGAEAIAVRPSGSKGTLNLAGAVRLWPTPSARLGDSRGQPSPELAAKRLESRSNLDDAVAAWTSERGPLNPAWVEWLMGFPIGWTDCELSETPSSPPSASTSAACSSTEAGEPAMPTPALADPAAATDPAPIAASSIDEPQPRSEGAAALDGVAAFLARFVAFPAPEALTAVTLWAAHTHAIDAFYVTPRLVLDSAEPESGKTRVLELLALLCRDPELTISATVPAIFRLLAEQPYSLLFDEVDAIFNPRNGGNYEDLRALLNAGYKRGATIARCVGDASKMQVQRFKVFAPVALAGLAGNMPDTITTRAITVHMRRRRHDQTVDQFRERDVETDAAPIRGALARWIGDQADQLADARPAMPVGVADRQAEVWEALLAIADAAGGDWPERARDACRYFVLSTRRADLTLGVRLLNDLRALFTGRVTDRLPTTEILKHLLALDESPWADLGKGRALDARRLARELARYDVKPTPFRVPGDVAKGYVTYPTDSQGGLTDAWSRYLPPLDPDSSVTAVTSVTAQVSGVTANHPVTATAVTATPTAEGVTDVAVTAPPSVTPLTSDVTDVTAVTAKSGDAA